ncbi:uncharacterized protein LOC135490879 [Lineus longissimus]|uniref:uncharacterized protein LOC135490879 n=1 Tax=Lineus longissimus TaxID=88925 RepID=UPI002B4C8200
MDKTVLRMTVFTYARPYPALGEEKEIDVEEFAAASEILPVFLDKLGCFPEIVKNDVRGNIRKMRDALAKDGIKYIKARLEKDKLQGIQAKGDSSSVAVLWLRRALLFMWYLQKLLIEDHLTNKEPDSLYEASQKAYSLSLDKYHNFATRAIFKTVLRFVPTRTTALASLADGAPVAQVIQDMQEMMEKLWPLLVVIRGYFIEVDEVRYKKEFRGED